MLSAPPAVGAALVWLAPAKGLAAWAGAAPIAPKGADRFCIVSE